MRWYDRFTGQRERSLPSSILPGRFATLIETDFNEHSSLKEHNLLVSDGTDRFQYVDEKGDFLTNELSVDQTAELGIIEIAVIEYQYQLIKGYKASFLIPEKLLARFELSKFEDILQETLSQGHLQQIAHRPKMELSYEEYLVPVSRAKKLSSHANRYLAAHSECWQARTFSGVIPKQILALESEDQLNIYENRIFVKLLFFIEIYLMKRIAEIRKLEKLFSQALNFQNSKDVYYELSQSIFSLWGEGFNKNTDTDSDISNGLTTLSSLENMLKNTRALKETKLYRQLIPNLHVPLKINMTNVLSHDQHYRHVARLWNAWLQTQKIEFQDPKQIYLKNKQLADSYSSYCNGVIERALIELNFTEISKSNWIRRDSSEVKLSFSENQEIRLKHNNEILIFIPCFSMTGVNLPSGETNNNRYILSLTHINDDNSLQVSPTFFYSVEIIINLIMKWITNVSVSTYGKKVTNAPSKLVDKMQEIDDGSVLVKEGYINIIKPSAKLRHSLDEVRIGHKADISINKTADVLEAQLSNVEKLLHCPVCNTKANINNWISRNNSCFTIKDSNCSHLWSINMKNSHRSIIISSNKSDINVNVDSFESIGRFHNQFRIEE